MSYNLFEFNAQFPDDRACLDYLFKARFDGAACQECGHKDCYHPIEKRRAYVCGWCGHQLYPTAGTIFHKSSTSLVKWFFAIFLFSMSKNGVAAMELQRQLGVTYKTAWRMAHEIRRLMDEGGTPFTGTVEADETYIGGKRAGKRGRGAAGKTPVIGVVERRGSVRAKVVENVTADSVTRHIRENVAVTASVITDELPVYNYVPKFGFKHATVNHAEGEYAKGRIHTNTIEGFWSQVKRSIDGTYHHVSRQHLQNYVNEFSFRYNNRFLSIWGLLMARLGLQLYQAA